MKNFVEMPVQPNVQKSVLEVKEVLLAVVATINKDDLAVSIVSSYTEQAQVRGKKVA